MPKHPPLKFILSLDADLLILCESDQTYRFVKRRRLAYWLMESLQQHNETRIETVIGSAIAATAFIPGTVFWRLRDFDIPPSATDADVCLLFLMQNGINLAYFSRDAIIDQDRRWLSERGISVAASPSRHVSYGDLSPTCRFLTPPPRSTDDWLQLRILRKIQFRKGMEVCAS